jgi:bla regulator protein BlaR1
MSTAICWTLVHSIWQGSLLSLLTGIVLAVTKNARSTTRYNLLSGLLVLFLATSVYTFIKEWKSIPEPDAVVTIESPRTANFHPYALDNIATVTQFPQQVAQWVNTNALLIISIWLFILAYRLLRISYSLIYTGYIRNHRANPLPAEWQHRLTALCQKLQVQRSIRLLESQIIKIPAVFGHWKPVIFLPAGLLAQLPPDQLEAILAHELSHIRRSDFLMNLLQNVVEAVFFFNPAVRWLSARIRQEREHCCDDLAIAGTGDKKSLVQALVSFKQFAATNASGLAVGFPGDRDSFLHRITRIVQKKNRTINSSEGIFLALSLLVVVVLSFALVRHDSPFAHHDPRGGQPARQTRLEATAPKDVELNAMTRNTLDTVPKNAKPSRKTVDETLRLSLGNGENDTIITNFEKKHYQIVIADKNIIAMKVNGRSIAKEEMPKYQVVIDHVIQNLHQQQTDIAMLEHDNMDLQAKLEYLRLQQAQEQDNKNQLEALNKVLADEQRRFEQDTAQQKEVRAKMAEKQEQLLKDQLQLIIDKTRQAQTMDIFRRSLSL